MAGKVAGQNKLIVVLMHDCLKAAPFGANRELKKVKKDKSVNPYR